MASLPFTACLDLMFPINRRHQGLATLAASPQPSAGHPPFPIKKRHQGMAILMPTPQLTLRFPLGFPINRRHQRLVPQIPHYPPVTMFYRLSNNRRYQGLAISGKGLVNGISEATKFPIDRRHQRLATSNNPR